MAKELFTIGYSGFPDIRDFIDTLKYHGVQILIDVRSSPFSAYYAQYNKDQLGPMLKAAGIYYYNYANRIWAVGENSMYYDSEKDEITYNGLKYTKSN